MKIAHIAPLAYSPGKLEYFSFIRGGAGADYHQNPNFYIFPGGELMMYWIAYDFDECSNNAVLLYSISKDRGLTWTDPQVFMADYPGGPSYLRILRLRNSTDALMLNGQTIMHEIEIDPKRRVITAHSNYFRSRTRFYLRRSVDGGRCFDHGHEFPYQQITGGRELPEDGCYGAIEEFIELAGGRVVAAFVFMDPDRISTKQADAVSQHYTAASMLSDDRGRSWKRGGEITADTPRGVMEPQIVETAPNRLFCLFRTKGGFLYQTASDDGGEVWTPSRPSPLPSPESMARMIKLQSGNLLVVWNNVSSTTQHPRHPLSAAISSDGGQSWTEPRLIADETGTNHLSNHALIQLDDGRIILGISRYHDIRPMSSDLDVAIFDENWLSGR